MLPSRGAVKIRAKCSEARNVWNRSRRITLDAFANGSRIRMPHPYKWNLSFNGVLIGYIYIRIFYIVVDINELLLLLK